MKLWPGLVSCYCYRLPQLGDGGAAEVDGGGPGLGVRPADQDTQRTEAGHGRQLQSQGEDVAVPEVRGARQDGPDGEVHHDVLPVSGVSLHSSQAGGIFLLSVSTLVCQNYI